MFSFKKHTQKDKLIKRSKKRTIVIASVVLIFVIALSLILSLSLRYYPSPGYKYMKHEIGAKNVARSDKIQKRILKDDSENVGIMFDARDDVSDHAFYGTEADATKKKDQKKAIKKHKSEGWAEYIEGNKKDKDESWYYVDTSRDRGAHHYNAKGEAIDEFLVSNKDENSLWIDPVNQDDDKITDTTGQIPILKAPDEDDFKGFDVSEDVDTTGTFKFDLKENHPDTPDDGTDTDVPPTPVSTIEPAKKDKTSAGDEVLYFVNSDESKWTEVSKYDGLKTSWLYLEKVDDGYQPQLIIYGLELESGEADESGTSTVKPSAGNVEFWEEIEADIWN